jgi:hypothetical protein
MTEDLVLMMMSSIAINGSKDCQGIKGTNAGNYNVTSLHVHLALSWRKCELIKSNVWTNMGFREVHLTVVAKALSEHCGVGLTLTQVYNPPKEVEGEVAPSKQVERP